MSWYEKRIPKDLQQFITPGEGFLAITITNLNTAADGEKIVRALNELSGITGAKALPHLKKVMINYDPAHIDLGAVGYTINQLGYRHIHRG